VRPYRSGKYYIFNTGLIDLSTGQISFHCRSTMRLLAAQLPPDEPWAQVDPPAQPLTDEDRLAAFTPAILAALQRPAPAAGCRRSQEDLFWGTSLEKPRDPIAEQAAGITGVADDWNPPSPNDQELVNLIRYEITRRRRELTDADEQRYQEGLMWECAVYHWTEGGTL